MTGLLHDLRYAVRQFRKNPGTSLVAVVSLGLGIAATTIVFGVIYAVLINPYPYEGADRMAHVHVFDKTAFLTDLLLSSAQFRQFKNNKVLDGAIAVDAEAMATTGGDLPESVSAVYFSSNAFEVFGVPPLLGRELSEIDTKDPLHPANVVVLSFSYWKAHYSGSKDVVGKTLQLDHENYTIVGVLPKRFAWWPRGDVYLPLKFSSDPNRTAMVFVRIKPGVSRGAAEQDLQASIQDLAKQTPEHFPKNFRIQLLPLNDIFVGPFAGTLMVVFGAVGLLLIIGCANLSILLLAQGVAREQELAVRAAIGANRARLVRQLLTESMTIAFAGAFLGIVLSYLGTRVVADLLPSGTFPGEALFRVNPPVLLFCTGLAVLTGIVFGLWPALRISRPELNLVLQAGSRKLTGAAAAKRTHGTLIASQIALSLVLLTGAGAAVRLFYRLSHANLGYDPHNVGCITVPLRDRTYTNWGQRLSYYEQIRQKVAAIPGVSSAAMEFTFLPPVSPYRTSAEIRGSVSGQNQLVTMQQVSPEYFSTLRIPLLLGRLWSQAETLDGAHVCIVNAAMAKRYWPSGDAIGQMVDLSELKARNTWMLAAPGNDGWVQITGVVGDTPNNGLRDLVLPTVYVSYSLVLGDTFDLVFRTKDNPLNYVHAVRETIHSLDANQVISGVTTAEQRLDADGLSRERFISTVFVGFALLGLGLGAVGLYSVVAYAVSQRTHEFGIRIALGARRRDVVHSVIRSSFAAVGAGVTVGLFGSLALSRLLSRWTGGDVRDPLMLAAVVLVLLVVVTGASVIPARRAMKTDPMVALRYE